ncbi:hypothetical protein [Halobacterium salinarum]|uniref:hypothetical protein n=1 Tax=Halobacterium salinarum TaxID=2242 RepID=UPI00255624B0|nr:hypothetical protein [Halobacterium salinarum]MDL0127089.1 hypothetical protein [Halobacterium salinarum]
MTDLEGVVVEFEFAGRILEGRVTGSKQEADIARGPVSVFNIDVPGAGTYDVVEDDIRAT